MVNETGLTPHARLQLCPQQAEHGASASLHRASLVQEGIQPHKPSPQLHRSQCFIIYIICWIVPATKENLTYKSI